MMRYKALEDILKIKKVGKRALQHLFWLSLVDPTSAEEVGVKLNLKDRRERIKIEFRKHSHKIKENLDSFIDGYFFSGRFTHFALAYLLDKEGLDTEPEAMVDKNPPIDVYIRTAKIALEIKRLYSSGEIFHYVEGAMNKYATYKYKNVDKILMVFIHPLKDGINYFEWATSGYKSLFQALKDGKIISKNFEFYIAPFYNRDNGLDSFIKSIIDRVNVIKGK